MRDADTAIEKKLVETAGRLLASGEVAVVLGYRRGTLPLRAQATFVTTPERAEELAWDASCGPNLVPYLKQLLRRIEGAVGVVVKGCDARSLVELIKEKQIPRERVKILGVPCAGVVDLRKLDALLKGAEIAEVGAKVPEGGGGQAGELAPEELSIVDHRGEQIAARLDELLRDGCVGCQHPTPGDADELLGDALPARSAEKRLACVQEIEKLDPAARWERFAAEMSKCIRCYACRQVCPTCYCTECFAEQTRPAWITPGDELTDVMLFHFGRLMHNAGRCTECGACAAACPMGVDLRPYTVKLAEVVQRLYGSEAGTNPDDPPALSDARFEDDQSFITEP